MFLPPLGLKLNMLFSEPAMASKEPLILGSFQLSSMNLVMELWSLIVWATKLCLAQGEMTSSGSRGP